MNCYYCNKQLSYNREGSKWLECTDCDVLYDHDKELGVHIKWIREINGNFWALNLYIDQNLTYLSGYFPNRSEEDLYSEIKLDYLIHVNKDNVVNKIKTILTFQ
jgi:hypothetical protein